MREAKDLYAKKQYVLNISQTTRIRELVHENEWKSQFTRVELEILMTNLILAEEIVKKIYPEENDDALKKGAVKRSRGFSGCHK
ncbi:MAG: hypothetical protein UW30_C0023G0005 [Candidatus Giovannonibacteria bacterium GW2011_GWA2_44_13b]|uniref:Uncharacterized protein n=1 Tax=Candidatus Giovannonibacteria bacterium GW2011_GWA2_44_13b TaxID=1618647 RepID=A0A0G1J872_9BACT|nr:MAG: hypothetical protein UW30_C0023G0005 [Candidatus Giovannonibacteria bacterium GW2011_GWA2_44_13b]